MPEKFCGIKCNDRHKEEDTMAIAIRAYQPEDVPALVEIWNEVVEQGIAFPQKAPLTNQIGAAFFAKQSCTAAAYDTETAEIVGMYILHPNNVGRCGHICNASYESCMKSWDLSPLERFRRAFRRKTERIPILSCIISHCKTNRPQKRKSSIIWKSLGCILEKNMV